MSIMSKIRGMGNNTTEEELNEQFEEETTEFATEEKPNVSDNVINFNKTKAGNQLKVMVIEPVSFDDAQQVADYIKNHKPVVVNFENTNPDIAKRIIDFISGTTYALAGEIKKVGKHVFMCAPSNVSVNFPEDLKPQKNPSMPWME